MQGITADLIAVTLGKGIIQRRTSTLGRLHKALHSNPFRTSPERPPKYTVCGEEAFLDVGRCCSDVVSLEMGSNEGRGVGIAVDKTASAPRINVKSIITYIYMTLEIHLQTNFLLPFSPLAFYPPRPSLITR